MSGTLAAVTVLAVTGCASPGNAPPPGSRDNTRSDILTVQPIALLFTDYDIDRDRRITPEEFEQGARDSFAEADADKNGQIPPLEFVAWAKTALGSENGLPGRMAFDPNFDSSISRAEFHETLSREFKKLDLNLDGILSRTELLTPAARIDTSQTGDRPAGPPPQQGGKRKPR